MVNNYLLLPTEIRFDLLNDSSVLLVYATAYLVILFNNNAVVWQRQQFKVV